jgi:hypothetical protein
MAIKPFRINMNKIIQILVFAIFIATSLSAQSDSIVIRDIKWDKGSPPAQLNCLFHQITRFWQA